MKMKNMFFVIALLVHLSSCSENKMEGEIKGGAIKGGAIEGQVEASADKNIANDTEIEPPHSLVETPPTASMPVPVAGAFLTCTKVEAQSDCYATGSNGKPYFFVPKNAFIIAGSPLQWSKTPFIVAGDSSWKVEVPQNTTGSFAVALENDKGEVISDWIIDESAKPVNTITDGGFESYNVAVGTFAFFSQNDKVDQTGWNSKIPASGATCDRDQIEVHSDPNKASEGSNWVQLNSSCLISIGVPSGNNTIIYQRFPTVPGHLYELKFATALNAQVPSSTIGALVNDAILVQAELTPTGWTTLKALFIAKNETTEIQFQELKLTTNSRLHGVVLDDVAIYDLGAK